MKRTRRDFLKGAISSAALVTLAPVVPRFLLGASARAAESMGETILVVVQLSGGNDGLNTVIPFGDDAYHKARPLLGVAKAQARRIDDHVGLHPSMEGFSKLLEDGRLAVVQGVGYPKPNRSHFTSMDIWHTARPDVATESNEFSVSAGHRETGWIGRYLDVQVHEARASASHDLPGMHLGNGGRLPLALVGEETRVTSVQNLEKFKLEDGGDQRLRRAIQSATEATRDGDDLVTFLQHGTAAALNSSKRIQESLAGYRTDQKYPETGLSRRLKTVAQLIDAGLGTRVYYLELDGFDTHANQANSHAALLGELSGAVTAFVQDLDQHGHGKQVMLMTFSEFGRRLKENASQGTDHGAAAPMFLAGGRIKPGLLSSYPSLTDLDEGDLKFTTDFRSVYAGVLEQWLGVPSAPVLGEGFPPLKIV